MVRIIGSTLLPRTGPAAIAGSLFVVAQFPHQESPYEGHPQEEKEDQEIH
jgi:hypothetical protein